MPGVLERADHAAILSAPAPPPHLVKTRSEARKQEGRNAALQSSARKRFKQALKPVHEAKEATVSPEERREKLVALYREVAACARCPLAETRTKAVFGSGNADADLMFVGEAPGAEEDRQGLPFVGRAGQLLSELLGEIGLTREDVFIANVLKSRPPGNRDPLPTEIEACKPYLWRQIELIEPRVIATLGNFATKLLTGNPAGITRVRGRRRSTSWVGAPSSCFRCSIRPRRCGLPR